MDTCNGGYSKLMPKVDILGLLRSPEGYSHIYCMVDISQDSDLVNMISRPVVTEIVWHIRKSKGDVA